MCISNTDAREPEEDAVNWEELVVWFEDRFWHSLGSKSKAKYGDEGDSGESKYAGSGIFGGRQGNGASKLRTWIACLTEGLDSASGWAHQSPTIIKHFICCSSKSLQKNSLFSDKKIRH